MLVTLLVFFALIGLTVAYMGLKPQPDQSGFDSIGTDILVHYTYQPQSLNPAIDAGILQYKKDKKNLRIRYIKEPWAYSGLANKIEVTDRFGQTWTMTNHYNESDEPKNSRVYKFIDKAVKNLTPADK